MNSWILLLCWRVNGLRTDVTLTQIWEKINIWIPYSDSIMFEFLLNLRKKDDTHCSLKSTVKVEIFARFLFSRILQVDLNSRKLKLAKSFFYIRFLLHWYKNRQIDQIHKIAKISSHEKYWLLQYCDVLINGHNVHNSPILSNVKFKLTWSFGNTSFLVHIYRYIYIKLLEFGWSCYIVWQICFVRADRPSLIRN